MATSPNRVTANRANARHSTGPKTPEGKARASQNARKHPFDPDPFVIVRVEDRGQVASLVAGAIATYQPINSQERDAVERIALAQHSIRRLYALEAGFFANALQQAPMDPNRLSHSEFAQGLEVGPGQHDAYSLAFGFNRYIRQSNIAAVFLRFQAQAERLYRRAVEDFHRLLKLRDVLAPEKYEAPIEPNPTSQPTENTTCPAAAQPPETANEAIAAPPAEPAAAPDRQARPALHSTGSRAHSGGETRQPPRSLRGRPDARSPAF
jgi:hypothetical protein